MVNYDIFATSAYRQDTNVGTWRTTDIQVPIAMLMVTPFSRLESNWRITKWIEEPNTATLEILDVAGDKNEVVNPCRRCEGQVPPILVLSAQQPGPFRNDAAHRRQ